MGSHGDGGMAEAARRGLVLGGWGGRRLWMERPWALGLEVGDIRGWVAATVRVGKKKERLR